MNISLAAILQELSQPSHVGDMSRRVQLCDAALAQLEHEQNPTLWASLQGTLGNSLWQNPQGDRVENLERAIISYGQALEVMTRQSMPAEWARTTNNLALAYCARILGERAENQEWAIELYTQALHVRTRQSMPAEWAQTTNNLANAYWSRIHGERAENLERAIELYEQALQVMTRQVMPGEWAAITNNLATTYWSRIRGERVENLERAIGLYEQALQVRTRQSMPVEWAEVTMNLANAYKNRVLGERAENLERAIELYEQALQVRTRQSMPVEWAEVTMNLANAYWSRIRGERAENLERAIELYEQALQVRTRQPMPIEWAAITNNLANAYKNRIRGEQAENLERAITSYRQILDIFNLYAYPDYHQNVQNELGSLYFQQGRWTAAGMALSAVLQAGERLYQAAATPEARQGELGKLQGIPAQRAYALLKSMLHDPLACQEAVLVIDRNRARWLSESLALYAKQPAGVSGTVWQHFVDLGKQIQELQAESRLLEATPAKRSYLVLSELLRTAYGQLVEIVTQIRALAPDFMPQPSFAEIQEAAQESTLIYLITTSQGGLALIVEQNVITPVWLVQLTEEALNRQLVNSEINDNISSNYLVGQLADPTSLRTILPDLLHWLGATIIAPLATVLRQRLSGPHQEVAGKPAITLIACGRLSLLPLHAANYQVDGKITSFLDEFKVNFAPSARSLNHARNTLAQRQQQSSVLLGVGNPLPVNTEQGQSNWHSLPNAKIELEEIAEQLNQKTVYAFYETNATRTAVLPHLSTATLLHLSCHGMFDPNDALGSGLQLADGMFTLRELLDTNLYQLDHLRLAVLSACQTAITDFNNLPDESIGLPAGFLQAGAPGVVGSLWPVEDRATALLMRRFYQNFLDQKLEPAAALGEAQCWLRDLTWEDLGDYYRSFISRMSASDALQVYNQSVRPKMQQDPAGRPYENPYYWAGFTFTGV